MAKHIFTNMGSLVAALKEEARQAMSDAESELYLTGLKNNSDFYAGTKPKYYKRTGQLGNALKTTGVQESGSHWEAEIYEDMSYNYTTGSYSTPKVFSEAEEGGSGILGKPHFWKRTEDAAEPILSKNINKHFK